MHGMHKQTPLELSSLLIIVAREGWNQWFWLTLVTCQGPLLLVTSWRATLQYHERPTFSELKGWRTPASTECHDCGINTYVAHTTSRCMHPIMLLRDHWLVYVATDP